MPEPEMDERLRNLQTITDAGLARLSVEDMLIELLERVRTILDADTAAVLLLDEATQELVARAACGLEEEVRQGVRVPFGGGFAGTIAKERRPVVLSHVDETTVANPILWEKGIQTMLGVPLMSGGDVIGVLHVGRLVKREFTPAHTELLEIAAERVAGAAMARRLAVETAAAEMLERGLMPTRLPQLRELQLAARYVPAESRMIGGDWYDAFTVPDGQLWLVTGDVAGHGLNAAVVMGRVKSALRAYALEGGDPESVLKMTDRKVQHFEMGTMVTTVCVTSMPPYEYFTVCTAGHPPPVIAQPNRPGEILDLIPGPPLGATTDAIRSSTTFRLEPGGVMVLYTDGLIERRGESIEDGLERLRAATSAAKPERVCQRVMGRVVGTTVPTDDIALLAVQRTDVNSADQIHPVAGPALR